MEIPDDLYPRLIDSKGKYKKLSYNELVYCRDCEFFIEMEGYEEHILYRPHPFKEQGYAELDKLFQSLQKKPE